MGPAAILSILVKAQGVEATEAQLSALNAAGKKAATGLGQTEAAAKRTGGAHLKAAKAVAGFVGAYAAVSTLHKSVDTTEALGKSTLALNKSFGLATKTASEWAAVAGSRGVDGKQLAMGFKTLSSSAQSAAGGSKTAIAQFKQLGISQAELTKHSGDLNWMLKNVSDGLGALPGGTQKANLQSKLFGRS